MSKRSVYTTITPLPPGITRQTVMEFLLSHTEMIDLNPLVEERHPIKPPAKATPEEYHCVWYELTDKIQYLPGGVYNGKVTYTACFHDLNNGIQTHVYAPMGLDIKNKWTINGSMPGEPTQPHEIGKGIPLSGLYLREDVDMRCNMLMTSFVKKNLRKSHSALVDRLVVKAQLYEAASINDRLSERSNVLSGSAFGSSPGSSPHLSSLSLTQYGSSRSSIGSASFAPQRSPGLVPTAQYQEHDLRNSYLPAPGQFPYPQGHDPRIDPRVSIHPYAGQQQQYLDPGYQAYLMSQRQNQSLMPSEIGAPGPRDQSNIAEMSSSVPVAEAKKVPGGPLVHPSSFAAELE